MCQKNEINAVTKNNQYNKQERECQLFNLGTLNSTISNSMKNNKKEGRKLLKKYFQTKKVSLQIERADGPGENEGIKQLISKKHKSQLYESKGAREMKKAGIIIREENTSRFHLEPWLVWLRWMDGCCLVHRRLLVQFLVRAVPGLRA